MRDMNLKMLLSLEYWFALRPVAQSFQTAMILTAFFGLLFVLSFAFKAIYRKMKKTDRFMSYVYRKLSTATLSLGIAGLVLTFFRYQGAPLFGMRIWYFVWLVTALIWGAQIAWYRFKELPKLLAQHHEAAVK
jgi:hypothetical protein